MKFKVEYTNKAWKDLKQFETVASQKIVLKIKFFSEQPKPMKHAKELKGEYRGLYRFRIGDYRAIFTKDSRGKISILTILRVKHRKDIY